MAVISFAKTNGIDVPNIPTLSINNPLVSSTGVIKANNLDGLQTDTAPIYGARAWVNFNGVTTATIRASGNVSSVTRSGLGLYTINFNTNIQDTNYCVIGGVGQQSYSATPEYGTTKTVSSCSIGTYQLVSISGDNRQLGDNANVHVAIFR